MNRKLKISTYTVIRNNTVIKDNVLIISHGGSPAELLNKIYISLGMSYPKFHKMDMLCKLGLLSAEVILKDQDPALTYSSIETGIILMNSSSSINTDRKHQDTIENKQEYFPSPSIFVYTLPNVVIGEICIRHKIQGEGCFFISRAFDPDLMWRQTLQMFDAGIKRCITGWVETGPAKYESLFFLVEECNETDSGIINFSPDILEKIYTA